MCATNNSKPIDARTEALNWTGYFFQSWCEYQFRKDDSAWKVVESEHPVTFAHSDKRYPPKESVLDLWIRLKAGNDRNWDDVDGLALHVLIEAKRAHPHLKDWVFFPSWEGSPYSFRHIVRQPKAIYLTETLRAFPASDRLRADMCREVASRYKNDKTLETQKSTTNNIDDACYQISIATQCMLSTQSTLLNKLSKRSNHIVIPMVVTTANLYMAKFERNKVDKSTGSINEVEYLPMDFVVYEYPLKHHLQFSEGIPMRHDRDGTDYLLKKDILIVNSEALAVVLGILPDIFMDEKYVASNE